MIYLASPYTHEDEAVRADRYKAVERLTAQYITQGRVVFAPIVYTHNMCTTYDMGIEAEHWWKFNSAMLRRAEELHVLKIPGWEFSEGIHQEMDLALKLYLPIVYVDKFGTVIPYSNGEMPE